MRLHGRVNEKVSCPRLAWLISGCLEKTPAIGTTRMLAQRSASHVCFSCLGCALPHDVLDSWVDVGPVRGGSTRYCAAGSQYAVFSKWKAGSTVKSCFADTSGIPALVAMSRRHLPTCLQMQRSVGQKDARQESFASGLFPFVVRVTLHAEILHQAFFPCKSGSGDAACIAATRGTHIAAARLPTCL